MAMCFSHPARPGGQASKEAEGPGRRVASRGSRVFLDVVVRGQLLWRVCWMRPRTLAQFAAGWRFQRLKRERDFLLARASQGRTNIAALSTVALASRQVLRDAQHAPSSWSYFARVGVAPLTGDVNEPTLHALISLWRDFRRLPTLDLDHLERELDCRYPLRDEPLFVFGSNCSQEQRTDILARRLLRRTRLCMRREVQLRSAPTARNEATRSQPDSNHVDTYIDRIVQTFQDLAVAPFPNRCWFEDFVPRVYEWYDAEGACGQRVEALHDAIAAAILLHYELERRSVELRHAYCAFWRQRRVDSRRRAGSMRRSF